VTGSRSAQQVGEHIGGAEVLPGRGHQPRQEAKVLAESDDRGLVRTAGPPLGQPGRGEQAVAQAPAVAGLAIPG
jgi:hypothetical protein